MKTFITCFTNFNSPPRCLYLYNKAASVYKTLLQKMQIRKAKTFEDHLLNIIQ